MPTIITRGAGSAQALGFGAGSSPTTFNYVEDVFSTHLYTGTGAAQTITNDIALGDSLVFSNESTTALPPSANRYWSGLSFGDGNFLATNYTIGGAVTSDNFAYSSDGITWSTNSTLPLRTWVGSAYGNGVWVICSEFGGGLTASTAVYSSSISGTFAVATGFPAAMAVNKVRWVNDRFIATAASGTTMAYSLDGINWSSMTVPTDDWSDVAYGNGKWVCVSGGSGSSCITSTDGTTWSRSGTSISAYSVTFGNGIFVTKGGFSGSTYTSTDGITWTDVTSTAIINSTYQIIFDGTNFVVVGSNVGQTGVAYSPDGVNWTFRRNATTTFGTGTSALVAFGSNKYVVVVRGTANYSATVNSLVPAISGKDGLVWIKARTSATFTHYLFDTVRGPLNSLVTSTSNNQASIANSLTSFNSNGFTIGSAGQTSSSGNNFVSWSFRKQAKFFDVVSVSHSTGTATNVDLGSLGTVGFVIIKSIGSVANWVCWNQASPTRNPSLNSTGAGSATLTLTVSGTIATLASTLPSATYIVYAWAHNAGGFGLDGTQSVVTTGTFAATAGTVVNLGWEPQFLLLKAYANTSNWWMIDNMRGLYASTNNANLIANTGVVEASATQAFLTSTGFVNQITDAGFTYTYVAIRRGPMKVPTDATKVFGYNARTGTLANVTVTGGQTADAFLVKNRGSAVDSLFSSRLINIGYGVTSTTTAEVTAGTTILQANPWDVMDGVKVGNSSTITNASSNTFINYLFRRAPGFFDVVCYTGTGIYPFTINHNLGVAPELMIFKKRSAADSWWTFGAPITSPNAAWYKNYFELNSQLGARPDLTSITTAPTSTAVTIANYYGGASNWILYLFASAPGVSKVGSYTGTSATQTINCGFGATARFILIKSASSTGDWYVWDSARGIVAGNDPYFLLNSNAAEATAADWVDTAATGFELSNAVGNPVNSNGTSYLFLAIA